MPAAFSKDNAADDFADDSEFASYEVGAGLGGGRPFLRATLRDEAVRGEPGADDAAGADDEPRELRVYDKLARLDAGLPPLPPGEYPNETLMPPPRRPAPATRPAVPVAAEPVAPPIGEEEGDEEPVDVEREVVLKALEPDECEEGRRPPRSAPAEPPRSAPAPNLFRPLTDDFPPLTDDGAVTPAPTLRRDTAPAGRAAAPARRSIFRSFRG